MTGKWGSVPRCPACDKSVYPVEQVFAADRKPFHRGCINCQARGQLQQNLEKKGIFLFLSERSYCKLLFPRDQVRGCNNQMTAKGLHRHEGYNFCDWCHETLYAQREYGPGPGGETIEERRAREQRELEERERRLREIEEMRNRKVREI